MEAQYVDFKMNYDGSSDYLTISISPTPTTIMTIRPNGVSVDGAFVTTSLGVNGTIDHNGSYLGFFGTTPITQPIGGAATAGDSYGANEKDMLQDVYNAVRNLGLMS